MMKKCDRYIFFLQKLWTPCYSTYNLQNIVFRIAKTVKISMFCSRIHRSNTRGLKAIPAQGCRTCPPAHVAGRYDNPIPELTFSPQSGSMNSVSGCYILFWIPSGTFPKKKQFRKHLNNLCDLKSYFLVYLATVCWPITLSPKLIM